jgi:hypothetical protein
VNLSQNGPHTDGNAPLTCTESPGAHRAQALSGSGLPLFLVVTKTGGGGGGDTDTAAPPPQLA